MRCYHSILPQNMLTQHIFRQNKDDPITYQFNFTGHPVEQYLKLVQFEEPTIWHLRKRWISLTTRGYRS